MESVSGQKELGELSGRHSVVIGASMAGLLAGRVLAEHFARVTIIERDCLLQGAHARKGVPQGQHVHALLKRGANILDDFFPGLSSTLARDGAPLIDTIADVCWYHFGVWKARFPGAITGFSQSRPFLEELVRDCLAERANVSFLDGWEVTGLCASADHTRVTGVRLRPAGTKHRQEELAADLVLDASGRGSQAPQWLLSMGYSRVEESVVRVDVGYASRIYPHLDQASFDGKALIIYPTPPHGKRVGYIFPIEGGRWMVTLAGWLQDYPPGDEQGFLDYARSLPMPNLYEAIKDADGLAPIVTHKFPANRWRHYERMRRFPDSFIVLGDAACSFNPIYGQGMTTAALQAGALSNYLPQYLRVHGGLHGFAPHFQKKVARAVRVPWLLATGEDFRYPETQGSRPPGMRLYNWYAGRVHELSCSHPLTTLRFYEVLHMLKSPAVLFNPRTLFAVLFNR
ncbi:MAG TPA: FAD-dependent monooxygenase [Ktedonobacteraceae bacterium]|nr:FAD-dependent monooxygenase [Ktedonobacteraceae bacterium]